MNPLQTALDDVARAAENLRILMQTRDISVRAKAKYDRDFKARVQALDLGLEYTKEFCRVIRLDARNRFVKSYGIHPRSVAELIATRASEKHPGGTVVVEPVPPEALAK